MGKRTRQEEEAVAHLVGQVVELLHVLLQAPEEETAPCTVAAAFTPCFTIPNRPTDHET